MVNMCTKGDKENPGNYRGILLLSVHVVGKVCWAEPGLGHALLILHIQFATYIHSATWCGQQTSQCGLVVSTGWHHKLWVITCQRLIYGL